MIIIIEQSVCGRGKNFIEGCIQKGKEMLHMPPIIIEENQLRKEALFAVCDTHAELEKMEFLLKVMDKFNISEIESRFPEII